MQPAIPLPATVNSKANETQGKRTKANVTSVQGPVHWLSRGQNHNSWSASDPLAAIQNFKHSFQRTGEAPDVFLFMCSTTQVNIEQINAGQTAAKKTIGNTVQFMIVVFF